MYSMLIMAILYGGVVVALPVRRGHSYDEASVGAAAPAPDRRPCWRYGTRGVDCLETFGRGGALEVSWRESSVTRMR
jgi:hypothetical protein